MGHPDDFELFEAEVISAQGHCDAGHSLGMRFKLSCWEPGGLCGFFYHDIFPGLSVMQFGGQYPWLPKDEMTFGCPDAENQVVIKVRRV